jgi:phosphatidylserine/phosphatidylglycerophosphate/cardiolipin synthase-like enzyme
MPPQANAIANNDVAMLAWSYDNPIPGCLGFAIYRKEGDIPGPGQGEPLPAWVGFQGQTNPAWTKNTTEVWPIQKFQWNDLTATRGKTYGYRIVPMVGTPEAMTKQDGQAATCGPVTLTPQRGCFATYFNRGILSSQFVAHQLPVDASGRPDYKVLTDRIDQPGDPLRQALAGQILEGLESLLDLALQEGGSCYAALYELNDPELLQKLLNLPSLHLILSNTGTDDKENTSARQALHEKGIDIIDRFVPSGHIGHNKFVVYVDPNNQPGAVLLGSTNWTDTAICAQSNNALLVKNPELAQAHLDYWQRLRKDTNPAGRGPQGPDLRQADASPGARDVAVDSGKATVWFSPNSKGPRPSPRKPDEPTPVDLSEVFSLMDQAKEGILFLVFQPGVPSIVDKAAEVANANPNLFVRGAATDPKAVNEFNTVLVHRAGEDPVEVVVASAITDQFSFWERELLKASPGAHAIIHDKIVVIDPMSADSVVVTGSHNLGYRASCNNDENLLIVRGHQELAQAYAVHVMDVYDHYRFRYQQQLHGDHAFTGLDPTDAWQQKYFDPTNPASHDNAVWL